MFPARCRSSGSAAFVLALFVSNLLLAGRRRPVAFPRALCGAALTLDTLLLSGLLHATGGASNPFSVLYLVYITLAAVVLGARWTWFLAALSVGCYGLLFAALLPLEHASHLAPGMQLHLQGMWVAFCVAAVLTAYFVVQMSTAIEQRDAEMSAMRDRAARSERLASLTTLAAGAAHELGTPLATIAVAARELERSIRTLPGAHAALVEDATLIRSEVDRCRAILNRLGAQVGQAPARYRSRPPRGSCSRPSCAPSRSGIAPGSRPRSAARPSCGCPSTPCFRSPRTCCGTRSTPAKATSACASRSAPPACGWWCRTRRRHAARGSARVGEPFFSTKAPGAGLGLGVFIARSLCEEMGGRLTLESSPDEARRLASRSRTGRRAGRQGAA